MFRVARTMVVVVACIALATPGRAQSIDRALVRQRLAQADELTRRNAHAEVPRLLEPLTGDALRQDPKLAAEVHHAIGLAYYRLVKYPDALVHFRRALEAAQAAGDRVFQARILSATAYVHKNSAAHAEGLATAREALALFREAGVSRDAASTWVVLGAIYDLMGDHRRALDSYAQALPLFGDERSPAVVSLLYETGISHKNVGDFAEALRYYGRALDMATAINDRSGRIFTLGNLGVLHNTLGDPERAIQHYEEAGRLAREEGNRRIESLVLLSLGETYALAGNQPRALATLEQELSLSRELGGRTEEASTLKKLGDIHAEMGDDARAVEEYRAALAIQRQTGERRNAGETLVGLTDLTRRAGRTDEAVQLGEEAVATARESYRPHLEWDARRALAQAVAAAGQTTRAIDELRASARIVNDLRASVASDRSKIAFVDRRQEVFEELALLLVRAGRPGEALEAVEAGRARALADLLEQRQILGKPAERQTLATFRQARTDLQEEVASAPAGRASRPDAAPGTRSAAYDSSLAALTTESQELASLLTAESPGVPEIAETAKRLNATLVEYLVTAGQLLAWVVDRAGAVHVARVDVARERLESLTGALRESLDAATANRSRASGAGATLRELYKLLIAPIETWLPSSRDASLLVVPHGPLALVPFAALEDEAGRPLLERYVLSFAPAASVYGYTSQKRVAASARRPGAMIVADPTPPAGSGIERLPFAREEGRLVASHLRGTPVHLLNGSDASEAAVKRQAGGNTVLHFATHGLIAPDRPLASSLVLGAGAGEDGYLRVDEIFNLDLTAEMIVLSGCSTGLGRQSGDGIIGLTRAFLYAGTPTVVVSQWNVSDRATSALMNRFYAELRQGRGKAAALRAASLATRKQFPHPALWAAFQLIGEP